MLSLRCTNMGSLYGFWNLRRLFFATIFLSVFIFSYLFDWWSVRVETQDTNGMPRFRLVARINWYATPSKASYINSADYKSVDNYSSRNGDIQEDIKNVPWNLSYFDKIITKRTTTLPPILRGWKTIQVDEGKSSGKTSAKDNINTFYKKENHSLDDGQFEFKFNAANIDIDRYAENYIPNIQVKEVNCKNIAAGDPDEIQKAELYQRSHPKKVTPDEHFVKMASDCPSFIRDRRYATAPLSEEEAEFSIAYTIVMFKDVEQTERLLRAIYRPQNYYCVHVDLKSSAVIWKAIKAIVKCFDNVFLTSRAVDVQWGWYSVLEPEIICMEDLWKYKRWKYFINLTGQEFPLHTNWDIVKVLKALNGANNVEGTVRSFDHERTHYIHDGFYPSNHLKLLCPVHIRLAKGSVHVLVQRQFVDHVLHNDELLEFRRWVSDTGVPDETFFSSINYSPNLNIPGSYKGEPETDNIDNKRRFPRNPFIARFKNWGSWPFDWQCHGKRVRMVCVFGIGDLPLLAHRKELFANKFYSDYHPLVYDCLEELHYNKTRDQVLLKSTFDDSFYKKLDIVSNHVT